VKSADKNFFSPGFIDSVDIESLLANFSGKTGEEVKGPKVELRMGDIPWEINLKTKEQRGNRM